MGAIVKRMEIWLEGKKTYLVAIAMVIVSGLHVQGYLSDTAYLEIQGILTGSGIAALRAGITKQ